MSKAGNRPRTIRSSQFGLITLVWHPRAKRLGLCVRPFHDIRLTIPPKTSLRQAERFVQSKHAWLNHQVSRIRSIEEQHQWRVEAIKNVNRSKARQSLVQRLDDWSEKFKLPYNRVHVRAQTMRWGSCSSKNNINLNFQMMLLSAELIDYIILHELTHTKVRNHGILFWNTLGSFILEPRKLDRKLRDIPIIPSTWRI